MWITACQCPLARLDTLEVDRSLWYKYMADMLTEYKPNRPLRSLGSSQLEIPRVHTKQGESAFSYFAARSWNQLPEEIRCAKTLATFKSSLKTHLFSCAFVEWALCYVRTECIILCIILFYLTVLNFILNQFLYHFKFPCFYCCEWLFHFLLCKALWITTVYEMCYTNKLALPCLSDEIPIRRSSVVIRRDLLIGNFNCTGPNYVQNY